MVGEVFAGLSAFKTMFDLAKRLKDINDTATRNAVSIELQEKILAAQAQQSKLVDHVRELEKRVADLETWDADKQNYELKEVAAGQFAYVLEEEARGSKTAHMLCANCYDQNQKSVLQTEIRNPGRHDVLFCQRCGGELFSPRTGGRDAPHMRRAGTWGRGERSD